MHTGGRVVLSTPKAGKPCVPWVQALVSLLYALDPATPYECRDTKCSCQQREPWRPIIGRLDQL